MRRPKQEIKLDRITATIPAWIKTWLIEYAKQNDRSRSDVVTMLLERAIAAEDRA